MALLAAALISGCGNDAEVEVDPVVVQVGERSIHLSELQAQLDYWSESGSVLSSDPEVFMDRYVERAVALEKARALGLDQDPELRSQWESLLIGRLRTVELNKALASVVVTAEDVSEYYQDHLATYTTPRQIRLALLLLEVNAFMDQSAREQVKSRLIEAREQAQELPADTRGFGALASHYSEEGTSRFKGGDIGWLQAGLERSRWPAAVMKAAFALRSDAPLSAVIETEDGYYLLKLLDERPEEIRALDETLRVSIEKKLFHQQRATIQADLSGLWAATVPVVRHTDTLSLLDFHQPANTQVSATELTPMPRP